MTQYDAIRVSYAPGVLTQMRLLLFGQCRISALLFGAINMSCSKFEVARVKFEVNDGGQSALQYSHPCGLWFGCRSFGSGQSKLLKGKLVFLNTIE